MLFLLMSVFLFVGTCVKIEGNVKYKPLLFLMCRTVSYISTDDRTHSCELGKLQLRRELFPMRVRSNFS